MKYDFDKVIERRGTASIKWDFYMDGDDLRAWEKSDRQVGDKRLLPLWVADMDFASPQPVIDALVKRAQHGLFGYTGLTETYKQIVVDWMKRRYRWSVDPDWILTTPGVVTACCLAVRAFVKPGDKVIIQTPVYYPFNAAIENNGAIIARNPLIYNNGRYTMDFEHLEKVASQPDVTMAILCSPHNPVGRVWTREEIQRFGEICTANDVLVISDELHCDLIYDHVKFTPYGWLGEDLQQNVIITTAPSKTFNLPGLKTSNIIIQNESLREKYAEVMRNAWLLGANVFGAVAVQAAYSQGEEWLGQMMAYVQENCNYLREFLAQNLPDAKLVEPEGTYLIWVDLRNLGIPFDDIDRLFFNEARVYLDDGIMFGDEGAGFTRINIACPRSILAEALERMCEVIKEYQVSRFK